MSIHFSISSVYHYIIPCPSYYRPIPITIPFHHSNPILSHFTHPMLLSLPSPLTIPPTYPIVLLCRLSHCPTLRNAGGEPPFRRSVDGAIPPAMPPKTIAGEKSSSCAPVRGAFLPAFRKLCLVRKFHSSLTVLILRSCLKYSSEGYRIEQALCLTLLTSLFFEANIRENCLKSLTSLLIGSRIRVQFRMGARLLRQSWERLTEKYDCSL